MKINIKYGADQISKEYAQAPTVRALLSDSNIRAVLGFGDNVKVLVNGVEQATDSVLAGVCDVVIETKSNSKASGPRVTIKYGADEIQKTLDCGATIDDVLGDDNIAAVLGFGDNVKALISGVEQCGDTLIAPGCTIVIETKANSKAN